MDFVKDNNPKHLLQVSAMIGNFPAYVKEASANERQEEVKNLVKSAFADQRTKEFPLNTKENTYLSYAYYKSANCEDVNILKNIETAVGLHGIGEDVEPIDSVFNDLDKQASTDVLSENFALSINYGDSVGVKYYYPVNDQQTITKSARDLSNDFAKMPIEAFRHASKNLVKAARKINLEVSSLPDRIRRNGIDREFNYSGAKVACKQRSELLGEGAGNVYEEILKSASIDVENIEDYINLFTDMDRMNGVKYSSTLLNPYESFFSGIDKLALEKVANAYVVVSDAPIPLDDFTKAARKAIEENFCSEDQEKLLGIVKAAEDLGGLSASEKLIQFPEELQKQFLGSLLDRK